MVYAWIDAASATLSRLPPLLCSVDKIEKISKGKTSDWKNTIKQIAGRLNDLLIPPPEIKDHDKKDAKVMLSQAWLIRLANFLMPEVSGVEEEFFICIKKKKLNKLVDFWDKHWEEVAQFREKIFNKMENDMKLEKSFTEKLREKGEEYADKMGIKRAKAQSDSSNTTAS